MQTENLSGNKRKLSFLSKSADLSKTVWVFIQKNILKAISDILLITALFVTVSGLCILAGEKITGDMVFICGYKPVYIISGSMNPCIKEGAVIIIEKCSYEDTDIGDIITFKTDNGYVTHRLVGIDEKRKDEGSENFLITKGDANNVEDMNRLAPCDIKGKVAFCMNIFSIIPHRTI